MPQPESILYFCPSSFGGIPDYAHQQAEALGRSGCRVIMLCQPEFPHRSQAYEQDRCLPAEGIRARFRPVRILKLVVGQLDGFRILDRKIRATKARHVIMASYSEYLAPLWAWRFRRWRKHGVVFGAVAHDPVRDFVVGPLWWHRWSISEGYSFLDHAFVHESIILDTGSRRQPVATTIIPMGSLPFPDPPDSRTSTRTRLRIPDDAPLFLSFGHLRDGKNLRLILKALVQVPTAWLLVAGTEAGSGHTSSAEYQKIAAELGVGDRCRWLIGFATAEQAADYFNAADHALLTYQASFRSASGVLNVSVRYRRPVVASCGESNLASSVEHYDLGFRVAADDAGEIARGMRRMLSEPLVPRWDAYEQENSWETNATRVIAAFATP